jgi:protein involved in ribonucleotide reduction
MIVCIYRSPTGNFTQFIKSLDRILTHLTKPNTEVIICGDFNIDFSQEKSSKRQEFVTLLATYKLISTIKYPTKCSSRSNTTIDNIFIDFIHKNAYSTYPIINGLSDHDGQLIQFHNLKKLTERQITSHIRDFSTDNIQDFNIRLSFETWENVFDDREGTDVNRIFNNFHNTFLRIFYSSFPEKKKKKKIHSQKKHSPWMTKGLKISINHKRDLYLRCKYSND